MFRDATTNTNALYLYSPRPKATKPLSRSRTVNASSSVSRNSVTKENSGGLRKSASVRTRYSPRELYLSPLIIDRSSFQPLSPPDLSSDDDFSSGTKISSNISVEHVPSNLHTRKQTPITPKVPGKPVSPPKSYCERGVQTDAVESTVPSPPVISTPIVPSVPPSGTATIATSEPTLSSKPNLVPTTLHSPALDSPSLTDVPAISTIKKGFFDAKLKAWTFAYQTEFMETKQDVLLELRLLWASVKSERLAKKATKESPVRRKNPRYSLPELGLETHQTLARPAKVETKPSTTPVVAILSTPQPSPIVVSVSRPTSISEATVTVESPKFPSTPDLSELAQARTTAEEVRVRLKLGLTLAPLPEEELDRVCEKGWYKELQSARRVSMRSKRYSII